MLLQPGLPNDSILVASILILCALSQRERLNHGLRGYAKYHAFSGSNLLFQGLLFTS